jgi:hypothetical protein
MRFVCLSLLVGLTLQTAEAEPTVAANMRTPVLGWVFDREVYALRPVLGTLGAAIVGDTLDLGFPLQAAVVASQRSVALAVSADDHQVYVISLSGSGAPRALPGAGVAPDTIAFSASGNTAVLFFKENARVQVVTGLPQQAAIAFESTVSGVSGEITGLEVNDAGTKLLVTARNADGSALWMLDDRGSVSTLPVRAPDLAVAFRPTADDAFAIASGGEMYTVQPDASVSHYGVIAEDSGTPIAVQVMPEGATALIAYKNGNIVEANMVSGTVRTTSCGCTPTGLYALNSLLVYQLNEVSAAPLLLVQKADSGPRLWFVPPAAQTTATERGEQ